MSKYTDAWDQHQANNLDGASHKPGSISAAIADLNSVINWPGYILLAYWLARKIEKTESLSFSLLRVPFNDHHTPAELSGQLAGGGIEHCVFHSTNSAFYLLVGSRQKRWAKEVAGRYVAGNPISPWKGRNAASSRPLTYYIS